MSELLKIKNLGDFGVNSDLESTNLSPEYFTSGINFRLRDGNIETYNGGKLLSTAPVALNIRKVMLWVRAGGNKYILMGTNGVYTYDGVTWVNVTPAVFPAQWEINPNAINSTYEWSWSCCQSGISIVINNPQIGPYYLNDGVSVFTPLPYDATRSWQDISYSPLIIRSHKEFLISLGTIFTGTSIVDHNQISWSAPASETGIPFTWDAEDLSTIAGSLWLSGQGGYPIDGLTLRDEFCIYSKNSIDFMRYVGGDLIWNVRPLSCETGLLTLNGVAEVYDRHILLTKNDILINDGNSLTSIIDRKLRRRVFNAISYTSYERSFICLNDLDKEAWVCVPERGYSYPNLAVVYAWANNQVYLRDTISNCVDAHSGPKLSNISAWDSEPNTWEANPKNWNTDKDSTYDGTFSLFDNTNHVYDALVNDDTVATAFNTLLERLNVSLGGFGVVCTTISMHPHIVCAGPVLIQMGASLNPQAGIQWKQAITFDPATMRKIDIRTTGPFHNWRIQSIGNTPFLFSGMDIVYEINGER